MKLQISLAGKMKSYTGNSGCYASITPDEISQAQISSICHNLGFDASQDNMHCTLIYSRYSVLSYMPMMPCVSFEALGAQVKTWIGHNNKLYAVLALKSSVILEANRQLLAAGAKHSFSPYEPHVTLCSDLEDSPDTQTRIRKMNMILVTNPVKLIFDSYKIEDISND